MYVPEALKVNKFQPARIPSNSLYFQRFGQFSPASTFYTGDEVPRDLSKVDGIIDYLRYAEAMASQNSTD